MSMFVSSTICSTSQLPIDARLLERTKNMKHSPVELGLQSKHISSLEGKVKIIASSPAGLGIQIQPINRRRYAMHSIGRSTSAICFAALNARCGAEQTQTITHKAPTITQAPTHIQEKSPQLDDGGTGLPPRDDGDGGGGGGGGGGNWSGGFFFFGFLAFLGFLKDKESEGDYRDSSRRR
ncbi:protein YELLOW LEAF 1, choloroplastic-like isoform X2 [Rhodamnia argentea]|uniref:Protein YELLOW LEAF 1, choloroplastic-like isoform X2 n=1 Tax=Rhodamnia argentea TaxID=178133 RepID=A0A8B8QPJ5_9MYRT|nr:protein YELLOW LEAF 1, choloroplastic-like isoform X2 [Rhodamnia argentea]XP_030549110.1 protein YELLOW LEAF 1, choloroplastic-like isoform X2 [Rhodamnia argentea]